MHPLPSSDDEGNSNPKVIYPQFNLRNHFRNMQIEIRMEFNTIIMFVNVVRDYIIYHRKDITWKKKDLIRVRVVCKVEGCP